MASKKRPAKSSRLRSPDFFGKFLLPVVVVFLAIGLYFILQSKAADPFPTTRDKYEWPFSRYSIWNMPIGSGAEMEPAGFNGFSGGIKNDVQPISLDPNAPVANVTAPARASDEDGHPQMPGTSRRVHLGPGGYHNGEANGCGALLSADDTNRIAQGQILRSGSGGGSWDYDFSTTGHDHSRHLTQPLRPDQVPFPYSKENGDPDDALSSLTGWGRWGCHGASAMSGLGGTIRKGELDGDEPIRHALKFQPYCHLYCHPKSVSGGAPFRWPAHSADGYSLSVGIVLFGKNAWYSGSNPELTMGSLIALPDSFDVNSLSSPHGRKMAQALKDYGAYMVDDALQDNNQWTVEKDASFNPDNGDMQKIMTSMMVVTNNAPDKVGGGGNPRVCYAPDFSNGTDDVPVNPNGNVQQPAGCPPVPGGGGPTPTTSNPTPTPTGPTPTPDPNGNPADINGSGRVDVTDLSILIRNYKKTNATRAEGDVNGDGSISITDLSILVKAWGT